MDSPTTQPTFIPHEAVTASSSRRGGGGLAELMLLVSIILLIVSGALAGGVFLYTQYLTTSNTSKLAQLNSAQAALDPKLIQQLTRLDSRMNAAQSLLSSHLAPTQLFAMLDQSTVQDVAFTSFGYNAGNTQQITLTMTGVAGSVNAIALQAQVFSQSGVITDPIFSNIDAENDGVHFNFTALVNPTQLSYESLVTGASPQSPSQPAQQAPAQQQAPAAPASPFQSGSASTTPSK